VQKVVTATGVPTTQTISIDYTVSATNNNYWSGPGGTVTFTTAPTALETVFIYRSPAFTQTYNLNAARTFQTVSTTAVENTLDKIVTQVLKNKMDNDVSIKIPPNEVGLTVQLPNAVDRASEYLAFDGFGNVITTPGTADSTTHSSWGAMWASLTEPIYFTSQYSNDLDAMGDALGLTGSYTIVVDNASCAISASKTFGPGVQFQYTKTGLITIASGVTLTIDSPTNNDAVRHQCFAYEDATSFLVWTRPGVIHPEWWGAITDDDIDDVFAARQMFFSCVNLDGMTVEFLTGQYDMIDELTDGLGVPHNIEIRANITTALYDNLTIRGQGNGTVIHHPVASGAAGRGATLSITTFGTYPFTIDGLTIRDIKWTGASTADHHQFISIDSIQDCLIENLTFSTNAIEGLYFGGGNSSQGLIVRDCFATDVGVDDALSAYNINCSDALLDGCKAYNCGQGSENQGFHTTIVNCEFIDCSRGIVYFSTWSGWTPVGGGTEVNADVAIINNNIFRRCDEAIRSSDVAGHSGLNGTRGNSIISNNQFILCTGGASIYPGADPNFGEYTGTTLITGNLFYDVSANTGSIIQGAGGGGPIIITNNTFQLGPTSQWAYGILDNASNAEYYYEIRDNTFIGDCFTTAPWSLRSKCNISGNIFNFGRTPDSGDLSCTMGGFVATYGNTPSIIGPDFTYSYDGHTTYTATATPTGGNWKVGDRRFDSAPAIGLPSGEICISTGTTGTFGATTGATTSGSTALTLSTDVDTTVFEGSYISIAGVTGTKRIMSIVDTNAVMDSTADATVSGAAITYVAPTWTTFGRTGPVVGLLGSGTVDLQNGDAKTTVYTVPAGKTAVVFWIVIRAATADLSGGSDYDVGSGANADTWRQAINLSSVADNTTWIRYVGNSTAYIAEPAGNEFGIKPQTGATADAQATMEVWGYLY